MSEHTPDPDDTQDMDASEPHDTDGANDPHPDDVPESPATEQSADVVVNVDESGDDVQVPDEPVQPDESETSDDGQGRASDGE